MHYFARSSKFWAFGFSTLVLLSSSALSVQAQNRTSANVPGSPQLDLPRMDMSVGMHRIDAQLARQPKEREIGLMFRTNMPEYEGMLFVFEIPGVQCFWMKNTLLPLTAAFVADDGRIVNLADMTPLSEEPHCSAEPVRYVLEMNQGWFDKRKIEAGQHIRGPIFKKPIASAHAQ